MKHDQNLRAPKYIVDGQWVGSVHHAYTVAVQRGYNGSAVTIGLRLRNGVDTWEELAKPIDSTMQARSKKGARIKLRNGHDAVANAVAALDARKREIAQRQREEDEKEGDNDG
jgi:hypothetical protein